MPVIGAQLQHMGNSAHVRMLVMEARVLKTHHRAFLGSLVKGGLVDFVLGPRPSLEAAWMMDS